MQNKHCLPGCWRFFLGHSLLKPRDQYDSYTTINTLDRVQDFSNAISTSHGRIGIPAPYILTFNYLLMITVEYISDLYRATIFETIRLNSEQSVAEIRPSSILCSVFRSLVPSDKRLRFSHMLLGLGDRCVKHLIYSEH